MEGHTAAVKLLLENPATDVNARNYDDYAHTALLFAIKNWHEEIVEALLRRSDIDVNAKDTYASVG